MTNPGKIILSASEDVGRIYKTIAVIVRTRPVVPVVTAIWRIQVELIAAATSKNMGLCCVIDEVVVVYYIVVGIEEVNPEAVTVDCVVG